MENKSKLRAEKPIPRMRILRYVKGLKAKYFDSQVKILLSNNLTKQENKAKILRDKNGKWLIPESNKNAFHSFEDFNSLLGEADFNFYIWFLSKIEERWMELDKDNSFKKMQLMYEIIGEEIIKWIEEFESIEGKIVPEREMEYNEFHQELWDFYKHVEKLGKTTQLRNRHGKPKGRPISKYKKFEDCLNLKPAEYDNFEKALVNYFHKGTWTPVLKTDYPSLINALSNLKFIEKIQVEPFAKAFCNSYNVKLADLGYRRKVNPDKVKEFKLLLQNIRSIPPNSDK